MKIIIFLLQNATNNSFLSADWPIHSNGSQIKYIFSLPYNIWHYCWFIFIYKQSKVIRLNDIKIKTVIFDAVILKEFYLKKNKQQ